MTTTNNGILKLRTPHNANSFFKPQLVKKSQYWITSMDHLILSLHAKGITTLKNTIVFKELYDNDVLLALIAKVNNDVI